MDKQKKEKDQRKNKKSTNHNNEEQNANETKNPQAKATNKRILDSNAEDENKVKDTPNSINKKPKNEQKAKKDANTSKKAKGDNKKSSNKKKKNKNKKSKKKKLMKTQNLNKRQFSRHRSISFTTYIEIDMHGNFKGSKLPLEWVPIIRDALYDALNWKVDLVCFISGQGHHRKGDQKHKPVLRPLVLLISKLLGFDCFIDSHNKGVVVVDISSYHIVEFEDVEKEEEEKEEEEKEEEEEETNDKDGTKEDVEIDIDDFLIFEEEEEEADIDMDDFIKDNEGEEEEKSDNDNDIKSDNDKVENYDFLFRTLGLYNTPHNIFEGQPVPFNDIIVNEKTYNRIKKRFPSMPDVCAKIISTRRTAKQAVEYIYQIKEKLDQGIDEVLKRTLKSTENIELIEEMKLVKFYEEKYDFDREVIGKIVHEKSTFVNEKERKKKDNEKLSKNDRIDEIKKLIENVLNRINKEITNENNLNTLSNLIVKYSHVPIERVIEIFINSKFDSKTFEKTMLNSSQNVYKAMNVMNIEIYINRKNSFGLPRYLPGIEVNLSNANFIKAESALTRIMNGLKNGSFAEIDLYFGTKHLKGCCKPNSIHRLMYRLADKIGFFLNKEELEYKEDGEHYFISTKELIKKKERTPKILDKNANENDNDEKDLKQDTKNLEKEEEFEDDFIDDEEEEDKDSSLNKSFYSSFKLKV